MAEDLDTRRLFALGKQQMIQPDDAQDVDMAYLISNQEDAMLRFKSKTSKWSISSEGSDDFACVPTPKLSCLIN
jgi:hypothetical protein